jgi:hypothetical protein
MPPEGWFLLLGFQGQKPGVYVLFTAARLHGIMPWRQEDEYGYGNITQG